MNIITRSKFRVKVVGTKSYLICDDFEGKYGFHFQFQVDLPNQFLAQILPQQDKVEWPNLVQFLKTKSETAWVFSLIIKAEIVTLTTLPLHILVPSPGFFGVPYPVFSLAWPANRTSPNTYHPQ